LAIGNEFTGVGILAFADVAHPDVQFASRHGTNDWVQLAPSSGLMM